MTTTAAGIAPAPLAQARPAPRRHRRLAVVVAVISLAALGVGLFMALRPRPPAVRAASIVGTGAAAGSGAAVESSMKQAATVLVDAARTCQGHSPWPRCSALYSSAADLIASGQDVRSCPPASAQQVGRGWQAYLGQLAAFEDGTARQPALPAPPTC